MSTKKIRILAFSGSLRAESSNTTLLHAMATLAPKEIEIIIYNSLSKLPFFNPDLEKKKHTSVINLRSQVKLSDGILIASPEYAHGIPGVLKNTLDWLVGSEEFPGKPIALINASSRAIHAQASLTEIIKTMAGCIVNEASLIIPITPGRKLTHNEIITHHELSKLIYKVINELVFAIKDKLN